MLIVTAIYVIERILGKYIEDLQVNYTVFKGSFNQNGATIYLSKRAFTKLLVKQTIRDIEIVISRNLHLQVSFTTFIYIKK